MVRDFNADAHSSLVQHAATTFCSRSETSNRLVVTRHAVAQSRALITRFDAALATDAARMGGPWPVD
jgi:hypothetical protein